MKKEQSLFASQKSSGKNASQSPARKLPKKTKRPKRRYILFSLKQGACHNSKQAFDLVLNKFSLPERKRLGLWFIEFNPENGKGIVRCSLLCLDEAKKAIGCIPAEFGAKTVKTSGTLKALKGK